IGNDFGGETDAPGISGSAHFSRPHFAHALLTKGLFWETLAGRSRLEHVQAGDEARYQGYRGYAACGALDLSLLLCCLRRILSGLSHSSERPPHLAPLRHRRIFIAWKPWGPEDDKMGSLAWLRALYSPNNRSYLRNQLCTALC